MQSCFRLWHTFTPADEQTQNFTWFPALHKMPAQWMVYVMWPLTWWRIDLITSAPAELYTALPSLQPRSADCHRHRTSVSIYFCACGISPVRSSKRTDVDRFGRRRKLIHFPFSGLHNVNVAGRTLVKCPASLVSLSSLLSGNGRRNRHIQPMENEIFCLLHNVEARLCLPRVHVALVMQRPFSAVV